MSETYGAITLPMAAADPFDPFLTSLVSLVQAAVNADTAAAWASVVKAPTAPDLTPRPVAFAFGHDPAEDAFTSKKLPALYGWRLAFTRHFRMTSDWVGRESNIALLWIPPLMNESLRAVVQAYRNALDAAIHRVIHHGSHASWNAGAQLSSIVPYAKLELGDVRPHELVIPHTDGSASDVYDGILATLTLTEVKREAGDTYDPISHIQGTVSIGEPLLQIDAFQFQPSVLSVTPATGPAGVATPIEVVGYQFFEDEDVGPLRVTVDGQDCTDVSLIDGDRIQATTPLGTAGAKDVVVILPSGATSAALVGGFTFT